ncbi:hypothetical protein F5884DRAFT_341401 [Xylogone sp. PMI_703]|nr:hypothetical protein F5884DRAFT_341401 [Xylogone sp. PMI_703]
MPWGRRAKKFFGRGNDKKKNDDQKMVERGSGANERKENEAKEDIDFDIVETSIEAGQGNHQAVEHNIREAMGDAKERNLEGGMTTTPILNLPPPDPVHRQGILNGSTESSRDLQRASAIGRNTARLWDEAYDVLCRTEPSLIKAYERDLLSFQAEDKKELAGEAKWGLEVQIQSLALSKIQDVENSPLKISVGQREIVVKEKIGKIVRGVLAAKDFIGSALSSEPHAALVWAGVAVVLPLLLNPMTQDEDATDGLAYISELLHRCKVMEDTYINCPPEKESDLPVALQNLKQSFTTQLVKLYTQILQYQIRLARQYSRLGVFKYLRDVMIIDNWKTMLANVKSTEEVIRHDIGTVDSHTLSRMDNALARLQKRADEMFTLQMKTKGQVETIAQNQLLQMLPRADAAAFDSFVEDRKRSKCLKGTRVEILEQISKWATGYGDENIFWLNGLAGTGKSTIAQTIADILSDTNYLGASFFFSRGKADRGDARVLFSTLAVQLAESSPTFKIYITDALKSNNSIGQKTLERQWKCLILHPLIKLDKHLLFPLVLVFVIDALDECAGDEDVRTLLRLFSEVHNLTNIRLRVFITSRPETPIRLGFSELPGVLHRSLVLQHTPQTETEHDIDIYLRHTLAKIGREKSLGETWPGDEIIKILLQRADRLFIYAATVCSFLEQARFPQKRLTEMLYLTSTSTSSTKELDLMYLLVLTTSVDNACEDDQEDLSILFRRIVGSIVLLYSTLSAATLMEILQVSSAEMNGALEGLHSVLDIAENPNTPIQLVHPSFRDFLLNRQRCTDPRFLISGDDTHTELFKRCLWVLSNSLKRDICNLNDEGIETSDISRPQIKEHIPLSVQYAAQYWTNHLHNSGIVDQLIDNPVLEDIYSFLEKHFLHWLELLSINQAGAEAVAIIETLWDSIARFPHTAVHSQMLISFVTDARYFVSYFTTLIEKSPLQVYNSALIFSPIESQIRRLFWKEVPTWIKRYPNVPENWVAVDGKLVHKNDDTISKHGPTAMSFSPNGQVLANAWGRQVDLWDVENRKLLGSVGTEILLQSTFIFSPNGKLIATVSIRDDVITLWNVENREMFASFAGHSSWVRDITFAPDSKTLASASDDHTIRLWDVEAGKCYAILKAHSGWVSTITFSADGQTLVSGSYDRTVRLWDVKTCKLRKTLKGHSGWINSIVFSPDGQVLASASFDQTVRLWNPTTGQFIGLLEGHQGSVNALVFSQNSKFVASLAKNPEGQTIRLWNVDTRESVQDMDCDGFFFKFNFSDDGSKLETNKGIYRVFLH